MDKKKRQNVKIQMRCTEEYKELFEKRAQDLGLSTRDLIQNSINSYRSINPMKMNPVNNFLKMRIQEILKNNYSIEIDVNSYEMYKIINIILSNDMIWNDFNYNLKELLKDYFYNKKYKGE